MKHCLSLLLLGCLCACTPSPKQDEMTKTSPIERLDPALDAIIASDAVITVIATGYVWSEGPLWLPAQQRLIFSDVPANTIYQWTAEAGASVYLSPSGYTDTIPRGGEPGSNGLTLDAAGNLVLCQHGDRRMARMQAPLDAPKALFTTLADGYNGKKFNSPNDAVFDRQGNLYFTDPPYGLLQQDEDPTKELPFNGVYKVTPEGAVTLLIDSLTRPNGIAFSPDEQYLYVANSDPARATWYRYTLRDGAIVEGGIWYDATALTATEPGLPDGMKVDKNGNVFATGPGGIFVFNLAGKLLGKIRFAAATSNCALADDDKTLYVTNHQDIVRVQLRK
ncbi:MAG TPA: SMP-30/gluconolactonase/LRE family protein [Saprospiraceae bacterium]|nr:SMP-30/gluconolactonase/LRE family protein [Saprospiraceae bacterium]HMP25186.1 SMP-30/gluconolactonase/LRE family protein [Saprospiraceae bacterium]